MAIIRCVRDPSKPFRLSEEAKARLDAMTEEDIQRAAESDPDNPPLTEEELDRMANASLIQRVRRRSGMTQSGFARAYRINLARLRDLEQGRTKPDSALVAYLTVIERAPEAVKRALSER